MTKTSFTIRLVIGCAAYAHASAFEGPGLGARATSMGGAFIAVADDWTAIYWNPAGLAQLKGSGTGVSVEYLQAKAHDSQGLSNPTPPLGSGNLLRGDTFVQFGNEPASFKAMDSSFAVPLPAAGFFTHWKTWTLAGGSYAPLGFSFDVSDHSTPGYAVSFKSQGYILNHNISLARSFGPYVSLGMGVNAVQAHLERDADKTAPTENQSASSNGDALNVQGIFGLLLHLGARWRAGAVYRTGQDLNLKGTTSIDLGPYGGESSPAAQVLRNPTTYGVGLAYQACASVILSADWQRTQWRAQTLALSVDHPGVLLQNENLDPHWTSTSRYRFGAEWRVTPAWHLRCGYFRDPAAVSYEAQALTNLVDVNLRYATAGFSYVRTHWRFNAGEQFAWGKAELPDRTLERQALSTSLGVDYTF